MRSAVSTEAEKSRHTSDPISSSAFPFSVVLGFDLDPVVDFFYCLLILVITIFFALAHSECGHAIDRFFYMSRASVIVTKYNLDSYFYILQDLDLIEPMADKVDDENKKTVKKINNWVKIKAQDHRKGKS